MKFCEGARDPLRRLPETESFGVDKASVRLKTVMIDPGGGMASASALRACKTGQNRRTSTKAR